MNCRICDAKMGLFGTYQKSAIEVARLYPQPTEANGVEISLYSCKVCGHYQIPDINSSDYYDDFMLTASHSSKMQELQHEQASELFALAKDRMRFIDIGCGDGSFLVHAASLFAEVIGVEPSRPYFELSKRRGLNVINEYLTEELSFAFQFDAFASRQVFEHLTQPTRILSIISTLVKEEAVGLIEVPNAQKMLGENRYFDLFSDHINYFTPSSLCYLAGNSGFDVISVRECFNRDYLEMYIRKRRDSVSLEAKRESDFIFIKDAVVGYRRVSAWGAGSKAQAIMTALGSNLGLGYFFDTDVSKHGKYVINSMAQITRPTPEKVRDNDLIIIFGVSYQDEIISLLTNEYGYSGDVLCLEGEKPCIVRI
jgi:2-polyprenyl-3-methyl-5-hydroxy-6-metoxy-1,4-benzoquinol methylase